MDIVKEKDICIECNPVSNQVLRYINDIRVHPIRTIHNYGVKVVIAPDDPGLFNLKGVTDDFYFLAIGVEFNLKDFKLAIFNSIKYSQAKQD